MRGTAGVLLSLVTLVQRHCNVVDAQIYHFDNVAVPANRSLHTLYAFYVYSLEESPDRHMGDPFVKFKGLQAVANEAGAKKLTADELLKNRGVQLSMMRYKDFWSLIDPRKFCSTTVDVQEKRTLEVNQLLVQKDVVLSLEDVDVYMYTVKFPNASSSNSHGSDRKVKLRSTGVYILVFSNCGDFVDATVSGDVVVKNAYGFLPGNEYHKMPFYYWLLLAYVALAMVWMMLSLRWWKELFMIQNCVAAVIFFGLIEAFLWYIFFNDWNSTGVRGKFLFILAILFTVLKSAFSYMLVLVASLGWGVTRPYLDHQVIIKIQGLCLLYIILDFIREAVLSFRHSHTLSLAFVLLCLLPVSLLNGTIFYWVFTALSTLMETLQERRQVAKLLLFQRLWKILILALGVATFTLLFQIFNLSRSITARWKYQWLFADGVSHMLFLFVLACMMYLWAPHKHSQRYAYSQVEISDKEGMPDKPEAVWADDDAGLDDIDADEGEESFWAATHKETGDGGLKASSHAAGPDIIGASAAE